MGYPTFEQHEQAWHELARGISGDRTAVGTAPVGPPERPGELIIIGSGIETIGFSVGDEALLRSADKVLFCVADPATVIWLKRLRPDALDLYVLYGDDKVRYTTYMQMAEAQLHWVRQGLRVVVVFYGHPGIFVLSTHRAIQIARREGHQAVMKAGVSALDTLCADLGVDPSHPGLQTHEATDALSRRRHLDTSLHVVLWQVGVIGELGYRRKGYLNQSFSYFVSWLQECYGEDYEVTHYIGSRYPTIDPLIQTYRLDELHAPAVQSEITGLSTFYLPPRDVVPTDPRTAEDLGILGPGQRLVTPASPLREIDAYGPREMAAFTAFDQFRIPPSYTWQDETEAGSFLIELRFDPELQDRFRRVPDEALADPRFAALSDRERAMLLSRDSGAMQIAAKGSYRRSIVNEELIAWLLNSRSASAELLARMNGRRRLEARKEVVQWLADQGIEPEWARLHSSLDTVHRNDLYPWTGVYADPVSGASITILGHRTHRAKSVVYLGDQRVRTHQLHNGALRWRPHGDVPVHGVVRFDHQPSAERRVLLTTWREEDGPAHAESAMLPSVDPGRRAIARHLADLRQQRGPDDLTGRYALRTTGRFARRVFALEVDRDSARIDGVTVRVTAFDGSTLAWEGGTGPCAEGRITFVVDPIISSIEMYGHATASDEPGRNSCYGARITEEDAPYGGPPLPEATQAHLVRIARDNQARGGLLLWHKWEKATFTNLAVTRHLASLF